MVALIGLYLIGSAWAIEPGSPEAFPGPAQGQKPFQGIEALMSLNQELPNLVCDESVASKAPTLFPSLRLNKIQSPGDEFEVQWEVAQDPELTDEFVIKFMLEDRSLWWTSPEMRKKANAKWEARPVEQRSDGERKNYFQQLKRAVSLEICTAVINPGTLSTLSIDKPEYFIPMTPHRMNRELKFFRQGWSLRVQDSEQRVGYWSQKWWMGGWVEPYEVLEVVGPRFRLKRLARPVTHETVALLVMSAQPKELWPLGYLALVKERGSKGVDSEKQAEIFKTLLEWEAQQRMRGAKSARTAEKVQEYKKKLISELQSNPGANFKASAENQGIQQILAKMDFRGGYIEFAPLPNQANLKKIYSEFLSVLEKP